MLKIKVEILRELQLSDEYQLLSDLPDNDLPVLLLPEPILSGLPEHEMSAVPVLSDLPDDLSELLRQSGREPLGTP